MEGIATVSFDSSVPNGLQIIDEDYDHLSVTDEMEGGSRTGFPQKWSGKSSQTPDLDVVCTDYGFQVTFLMCPLNEVKVLGMHLSTLPQDSKHPLGKCTVMYLVVSSRNKGTAACCWCSYVLWL